MNQNVSKEHLIKLIEELTSRINETSLDKTNNQIPIGISSRHVHLCQEDIEKLFGKGYELKLQKWLKQPGQFAAREVVTLVGNKGSISKVRVLGPARAMSQVEISLTDGIKLGIKAPIRESGDLTQAGAVTVVGPQGMIMLDKHVIIAKRHIHMHPKDAKAFGVSDRELVSIKAVGDRGLIFENTLVRVAKSFKLECHLDTDEANAAGLNNHSFIEIVNQEIR